MTIAAMAPADLDSVVEINAMNLDDVDRIDRDQLERLHRSSRVALVARAPDAGVVGFALIVDDDCEHRSERTAWALSTGDADLHLERVAFDMSYSGRGLGLALYDELDARIEDMARAAGAATLALTSMVRVEPPNRHAIGFHESRGFDTVDRATFDDVTIALVRRTYTVG